MAWLSALGFAELSTAMIACVLGGGAGGAPGGFTPGFQPAIVPFSVAKRNTAGAVIGVTPSAATPEIGNAPWAIAGLKTRPVGAPVAPSGSPGPGIATTSDRGCP